MAEVRKKVVEDKYDTSKIVKKEKDNSKNKSNVKSEKSKNIDKNNKEKKSLFTKFIIFCNGVKDEFNKVHWTTKNDMIKYSIACIFFIIFCSLFFFGIDKLFELIQGLFA